MADAGAAGRRLIRRISGGAGDVGCQHRDAVVEEVVVEAGVGVLGTFLGFWAAVHREQNRMRALSFARFHGHLDLPLVVRSRS